MKRLIYSGVRIDKGNFYIDYTYNHPDDIVDIVEPQLYNTIRNSRIYKFGYTFNDTVDSVTRTRFIHAIKQIGDDALSDDQLDQFIKRPLAYLDADINLQDIDCMVYPLSNRSPLVSKMIRAINDMTSRKMHKCNFEFVKQAPTNISFDFETFQSDYEDNSGYRDMLKYVKRQLIPAIHKLDYFSIAQNVKAKYRPYITGFIDFKNASDIEQFSRLKGSNILVIDDINTIGSTLYEILRKLDSINNDCNIYVYTLLGK